MNVIVFLCFLFASMGRCQQFDCGRTYVRQRRIFNGPFAEFGSQPWQVALYQRVFYFFGPSVFVCGGVLINEKFILSAAHCFDSVMGSPSSMIAKLGVHNREQSSERYPYEEHRIQRIIIHEHYAVLNNFAANDIALAELVEVVVLKPHTVPICLPAYKKNLSGLRASISGWGHTGPDGLTPLTLRRTDVLVVAHNVCEQGYGELPPNMLCAKGPLAACPGDSGSPLISKEDGRATLIGLLSRGPPGCSYDIANLPILYMNVSNYIGWIDEKLYESESAFGSEVRSADASVMLT